MKAVLEQKCFNNISEQILNAWSQYAPKKELIVAKVML